MGTKPHEASKQLSITRFLKGEQLFLKGKQLGAATRPAKKAKTMMIDYFGKK